MSKRAKQKRAKPDFDRPFEGEPGISERPGVYRPLRLKCDHAGGAYRVVNDKPVCVYCGEELEL